MKIWNRWLRFQLVGAFGFLLQLAMLVVFRSICDLNYLVASVLSVESAILHNFVWHEFWTWRDRNDGSNWMKRLSRFHLANGAISLVGSILFVWLFAGVLRMHYLAANVMSILICSILNFYAGDRLVFRNEI